MWYFKVSKCAFAVDDNSTTPDDEKVAVALTPNTTHNNSIDDIEKTLPDACLR